MRFKSTPSCPACGAPLQQVVTHARVIPDDQPFYTACTPCGQVCQERDGALVVVPPQDFNMLPAQLRNMCRLVIAVK